MRKRAIILFAIILLCNLGYANVATDTIPIVWDDDAYMSTSTADEWIPIDSVKPIERPTETKIYVKPTSVVNYTKKKEKQNVAKDTITTDQEWTPNAQKALWLGVIIPGAGQFYNRRYWKLPIVYGAFVGCAYAISWNGRLYKDYKQAYIDILTATTYDDPNASFIKILPDGYTIQSMGGVGNYTSVLNNRQNSYRRNRDLGIIAAVAVYALSLIDAYVDAQLFNFDISPDLTLDVEPQIYYDMFNNKSAELHLTFNF